MHELSENEENEQPDFVNNILQLLLEQEGKMIQCLMAANENCVLDVIIWFINLLSQMMYFKYDNETEIINAKIIEFQTILLKLGLKWESSGDIKFIQPIVVLIDRTFFVHANYEIFIAN